MHSEELPLGDAKPPAGHGETGPRTQEAQISGCSEMGKGTGGRLPGLCCNRSGLEKGSSPERY